MSSAYTSRDIKEFTFMEHTRRNVGMLMGKANLNANIQCIKEYIDNAADESIDSSKLYHINVILFKGDETYQVAVIDHGRGIPCDKLKAVFTQPFTTGKAESAAYTFSIGQFGIGSKAANAISENFVAITKRFKHTAIIKHSEILYCFLIFKKSVSVSAFRDILVLG